MRILLDACVDRRLARDIIGHEVATAHEMSWSSLKNGELLARAAASFDVFVTVDRNLSFQQNLGAANIAVIVLRARTNRLADLKPLVPQLLTTIGSARRGIAMTLDGP